MGRSNEAHVIPGSGGGWQVVEPGADAAHSQHTTQREAVENAKDLLQQRGGGEAVVHDRDGSIRESDRVAGYRKEPRKH
jgi:Uncharacterized protein conserved in bacteria (DUF2188)